VAIKNKSTVALFHLIVIGNLLSVQNLNKNLSYIKITNASCFANSILFKNHLSWCQKHCSKFLYELLSNYLRLGINIYNYKDILNI
jgi:hypothetical protein